MVELAVTEVTEVTEAAVVDDGEVSLEVKMVCRNHIAHLVSPLLL